MQLNNTQAYQPTTSFGLGQEEDEDEVLNYADTAVSVPSAYGDQHPNMAADDNVQRIAALDENGLQAPVRGEDGTTPEDTRTEAQIAAGEQEKLREQYLSRYNQAKADASSSTIVGKDGYQYAPVMSDSDKWQDTLLKGAAALFMVGMPAAGIAAAAMTWMGNNDRQHRQGQIRHLEEKGYKGKDIQAWIDSGDHRFLAEEKEKYLNVGGGLVFDTNKGEYVERPEGMGEQKDTAPVTFADGRKGLIRIDPKTQKPIIDPQTNKPEIVRYTDEQATPTGTGTGSRGSVARRWDFMPDTLNNQGGVWYIDKQDQDGNIVTVPAPASVVKGAQQNGAPGSKPGVVTVGGKKMIIQRKGNGTPVVDAKAGTILVSDPDSGETQWVPATTVKTEVAGMQANSGLEIVKRFRDQDVLKLSGSGWKDLGREIGDTLGFSTQKDFTNKLEEMNGALKANVEAILFVELNGNKPTDAQINAAVGQLGWLDKDNTQERNEEILKKYEAYFNRSINMAKKMRTDKHPHFEEVGYGDPTDMNLPDPSDPTNSGVGTRQGQQPGAERQQTTTPAKSPARQQAEEQANYDDIKTFGGKRYGLKKGADRYVQSNWVEL